MAWLAVDPDNSEFIYYDCPQRSFVGKFHCWGSEDETIELPIGSIEKLIGKKLTWEDEPEEI